MDAGHVSENTLLVIISFLPFLLLLRLTHNNNNNNNHNHNHNNIYPWSPLALVVFSGAHADVTLWDICEATPDTSGAFPRDDPDQDQWFEITRIMVDQMNRWIHSGQGFIGSFDLPWSKWSRISDPDPHHIKGTHPSLIDLTDNDKEID